MKNKEPLFAPGHVHITTGARRAIQEAYDKSENATALLLQRHLQGDWSEMDSADRRANVAALRKGEYILSGYDLRPHPGEQQGQRIWLLTTTARDSTAILLPEEDTRL